ncbi:MAG: hypothetical protein ABR497_08490 [Kiritimatiellia bacterium]
MQADHIAETREARHMGQTRRLLKLVLWSTAGLMSAIMFERLAIPVGWLLGPMLGSGIWGQRSQ